MLPKGYAVQNRDPMTYPAAVADPDSTSYNLRAACTFGSYRMVLGHNDEPSANLTVRPNHDGAADSENEAGPNVGVRSDTKT